MSKQQLQFCQVHFFPTAQDALQVFAYHQVELSVTDKKHVLEYSENIKINLKFEELIRKLMN